MLVHATPSCLWGHLVFLFIPLIASGFVSGSELPLLLLILNPHT